MQNILSLLLHGYSPLIFDLIQIQVLMFPQKAIDTLDHFLRCLKEFFFSFVFLVFETQSHYVGQASLEFTISQMLELKAGTTTFIIIVICNFKGRDFKEWEILEISNQTTL